MRKKYLEQGVIALEHFEMSINERIDSVSYLNSNDTIWRCCIEHDGAMVYITASADGDMFKVYKSNKFDEVGTCIFSESIIDEDLNSKIDAFLDTLK